MTFRWAAELRGTEIWLVEREPNGRDSTTMRAGTYAPSAWATLVFTRATDGAMLFVGSRLQPVKFAQPANSEGEWALGFEVAGSTDGAAVRPPRVSLAAR